MDLTGTILTAAQEIKARWKESFETLLNVCNEREEHVDRMIYR